MAIIKSCCFWKSLRKGCFASAIYGFVSVTQNYLEIAKKKDLIVFLQFYFLASCISTSSYIYEEREYLSGKVDKLNSKSFLGQTPSECARIVLRK